MRKELKMFIEKLKEFLAQKFKKYDSKLPYFIVTFITLLLVVFGTSIFIELTGNLNTDVLTNFDIKTSEYITSFRSPFLTKYFVFATHVGDVWGYLIIFLTCALLFYLFFKSWKYVGQLALILLLALSSNLILKQVINRARPSHEHLVTAETLSYPSGHAMTAMAFYGFLIYLFFTFKINKLLKFGLILLLIFLILSIGISRIYLGVHFPSDIVGGFIAGFIWVVFCVFMITLLKIFKSGPAT